MVFQAGANDLLAVIQILGADEPDHAIDQQRFERACCCLGTRVAVCLVNTVMRVALQRNALPGLKQHHVVATAAAR